MAKIRTLRKCALFRGLGYRDLAVLAHHVEEGSLAANKWLMEEGAPSDGVFILKNGKVRVSMKGRAGESVEMGPGEFLGELSVFEGPKTRSVGAQCLERCEYLKLGVQEYEKLRVEAPDVAGKIAQGILENLATKMSAAREYLRELVAKPAG